MTDHTNLIARLRRHAEDCPPTALEIKAADALEALEARLAEAERDAARLDWLERHLFDGKWDGTIGRPKDWYMAGPYRHTLQRMKGDTLRKAIDAAMQEGGE